MQVTCIKNLASQLNEAGKIKIGMKGEATTSAKGNDFKLPKKLDHIILTTTEKDSNENYMMDLDLMERLKKDPLLTNADKNLVRVPIRLLYDSLDLNFPTRYQSYNGGRLSCYGDGEVSYKRIKANFTEPTKCPCSRLDPGYKGNDKCKPTGTLTCVIDGSELFGQAHTFRTTSMNSVKGIIGGIKLIKMATSNRLAGLPLLLTLNQKNTVTPDGHPTIVYVMSVCYRGSMDAMRGEVIKMLTEEKQYLIGMDQIEKDARENGAGSIGIEPDSAEEQEFVEEFFPDARGTKVSERIVKPSAKEDVIDVEHTVVHEEVQEEIQTGDQDGDQVGTGTQEEIQEKDLQEEEPLESDENYPGEFPVGPYLKIYQGLLVETDLIKAKAFLKRLTRDNIVYWLFVEHNEVGFNETSKKPALLGIGNKVLSRICGSAEKPEVTVKVQDLIAKASSEIQNHELIIGLSQAQDQKTAADLCSAFFKPTPIDRTLGLEELVSMSIRFISKAAKTAAAEEQTEETTEEVALEGEASLKDISPETEDSVETYPRGWDDSEPIAREQKLNLAKLKKVLEGKGVIKPEAWGVHVAYFLSEDGKPHTSAKDMTKKQGDTFIEMLRSQLTKKDEIPF
jgi:hypothetical protein